MHCTWKAPLSSLYSVTGWLRHSCIFTMTRPSLTNSAFRPDVYTMPPLLRWNTAEKKLPSGLSSSPSLLGNVMDSTWMYTVHLVGFVPLLLKNDIIRSYESKSTLLCFALLYFTITLSTTFFPSFLPSFLLSFFLSFFPSSCCYRNCLKFIGLTRLLCQLNYIRTGIPILYTQQEQLCVIKESLYRVYIHHRHFFILGNKKLNRTHTQHSIQQQRVRERERAAEQRDSLIERERE